MRRGRSSSMSAVPLIFVGIILAPIGCTAMCIDSLLKKEEPKRETRPDPAGTSYRLTIEDGFFYTNLEHDQFYPSDWPFNTYKITIYCKRINPNTSNGRSGAIALKAELPSDKTVYINLDSGAAWPSQTKIDGKSPNDFEALIYSDLRKYGSTKDDAIVRVAQLLCDENDSKFREKIREFYGWH